MGGGQFCPGALHVCRAETRGRQRSQTFEEEVVAPGASLTVTELTKARALLHRARRPDFTLTQRHTRTWDCSTVLTLCNTTEIIVSQSALSPVQRGQLPALKFLQDHQLKETQRTMSEQQQASAFLHRDSSCVHDRGRLSPLYWFSCWERDTEIQEVNFDRNTEVTLSPDWWTSSPSLTPCIDSSSVYNTQTLFSVWGLADCHGPKAGYNTNTQKYFKQVQLPLRKVNIWIWVIELLSLVI